MHPIEKTVVVVVVAAPRPAVWAALADPAAMRAWMGEPEMDIEARADWRAGGTIVVSGVHHGPFRNAGTVLDVVPGTALRYTHLSSMPNLADVPDHHSVIAFHLASVSDGTSMRLAVERFATDAIYRHLDLYWRGTLDIFRAYVEGRHGHA